MTPADPILDQADVTFRDEVKSLVVTYRAVSERRGPQQAKADFTSLFLHDSNYNHVIVSALLASALGLLAQDLS